MHQREVSTRLHPFRSFSPFCHFFKNDIIGGHRRSSAYVTSSVIYTDRTSPTCEWVEELSVTAWRTACLYGVSHRQNVSDILGIRIIFRNIHRPHVTDVRVGGGVVRHRMAHCVLIRCFPQTECLRHSRHTYHLP